MTYYITTCITSLSAFGGLAFSLFAINKAENQEKTNALYMFARCIAIVFISVIPFFFAFGYIIIHSHKFNVNYTNHRWHYRNIP